MRRLLVVSLSLLAAAGTALAQDSIKAKPNHGNDVPECEISSITYKVVNFTAAEVAQTRDVKDVDFFTIGTKNKPYDFVTGESKMNEGRWAEAIQYFRKALRSDVKDPVKQMGYRNIAWCQFSSGGFDDAVATLKTLRREKRDTYYLAESYQLQYKCYLAKDDVRQMDSTLNEFKQAGAECGMPDWGKSAEIMQAEVLEKQGKFSEAVRIHNKYTQDSSDDVSVPAKLGDLRCLTALKNWSSLKSSADRIVNDAKSKKGTEKALPDRLVTAAFNALGDCLLNSSPPNLKEAMLSYLRGVVELNRSGEKCPEHEEAIAKSAIAVARFSNELKEGKDDYRRRAMRLMAELQTKYEKSRWMADVKKAVDEMK